jgi:hypothetical protein
MRYMSALASEASNSKEVVQNFHSSQNTDTEIRSQRREDFDEYRFEEADFGDEEDYALELRLLIVSGGTIEHWGGRTMMKRRFRTAQKTPAA